MKKEKEKRLHESKDTGEETVTLTANSIEELMQKIEDYYFNQMSDTVQTAEESGLGKAGKGRLWRKIVGKAAGRERFLPEMTGKGGFSHPFVKI